MDPSFSEEQKKPKKAKKKQPNKQKNGVLRSASAAPPAAPPSVKPDRIFPGDFYRVLFFFCCSFCFLLPGILFG